MCVTYWVNLLQNLPKGAKDVFVTLNPTEKIDEERVEFKKYLGHPVFNENAIKAQEDLQSRLQGENNTWFTGAWLRYGFRRRHTLGGGDVQEIFRKRRRGSMDA